MPAAHRLAIALSTGRSKDPIRVLQFIEHNALDRATLHRILERRGLTRKGKQFERKYLQGNDG